MQRGFRYIAPPPWVWALDPAKCPPSWRDAPGAETVEDDDDHDADGGGGGDEGGDGEGGDGGREQRGGGGEAIETETAPARCRRLRWALKQASDARVLF